MVMKMAVYHSYGKMTKRICPLPFPVTIVWEEWKSKHFMIQYNFKVQALSLLANAITIFFFLHHEKNTPHY